METEKQTEILEFIIIVIISVFSAIIISKFLGYLVT